MKKAYALSFALLLFVGMGCRDVGEVVEQQPQVHSSVGSCEVSDEVRLANLDEGEACGKEVGFCRPGLTCRVPEAGGTQSCHDDRVAVGEVCGTFSNIQCEQDAYCQLEGRGMDESGVCKSIYKGEE